MVESHNNLENNILITVITYGGMDLRVIYSCYWGSYLAVVAASLHLGFISFDEYNGKDILALNLFNNISENELGALFFMGVDDDGREIYVIGSKNSGNILGKTLKGIADIYGFREDSVYFIDLNAHHNIFTLLGILMLRRFKLVKIGIKLLVKGIRKNHDKLIKAVQRVKDVPVYRGNNF